MNFFKKRSAILAVSLSVVIVIIVTIALSVYFSVFYYGSFLSYDNDQREILKTRAQQVSFTEENAPLKREISPDSPVNLVTYYSDEKGVEALWNAMSEYMRSISI